MLLSLSPEYATLIANGTKTVELRRRFPEVAAGTEIWIYTTLPVGAITGRVSVSSVHRGPPAELWRQFGSTTGVARVTFDQYFAGCDEGVAVAIANHQSVGPIPLYMLRELLPGFVVPQSYRYLNARDQSLLANSPAILPVG